MIHHCDRWVHKYTHPATDFCTYIHPMARLPQITLYTLLAVEKVMDRLERRIILDELLPLLWDNKLQDPDVIQATVSKLS